MTTITAEPARSVPAKGIQITEKAIGKIRSAMAKEGVSPEQGGLRVGVQGGGCSGLSYNGSIRSRASVTVFFSSAM